jgi:hypothetical protein
MASFATRCEIAGWSLKGGGEESRNGEGHGRRLSVRP